MKFQLLSNGLMAKCRVKDVSKKSKGFIPIRTTNKTPIFIFNVNHANLFIWKGNKIKQCKLSLFLFLTAAQSIPKIDYIRIRRESLLAILINVFIIFQ